MIDSKLNTLTQARAEEDEATARTFTKKDAKSIMRQILLGKKPWFFPTPITSLPVIVWKALCIYAMPMNHGRTSMSEEPFAICQQDASQGWQATN